MSKQNGYSFDSEVIPLSEVQKIFNRRTKEINSSKSKSNIRYSESFTYDKGTVFETHDIRTNKHSFNKLKHSIYLQSNDSSTVSNSQYEYIFSSSPISGSYINNSLENKLPSDSSERKSSVQSFKNHSAFQDSLDHFLDPKRTDYTSGKKRTQKKIRVIYPLSILSTIKTLTHALLMILLVAFHTTSVSFERSNSGTDLVEYVHKLMNPYNMGPLDVKNIHSTTKFWSYLENILLPTIFGGSLDAFDLSNQKNAAVKLRWRRNTFNIGTMARQPSLNTASSVSRIRIMGPLKVRFIKANSQECPFVVAQNTIALKGISPIYTDVCNIM